MKDDGVVTIIYLAPEIIHKHDYSFEVDWWAIGIIGHQLRTGFLPFTTSVREHYAINDAVYYDRVNTLDLI